jgi:hypothetical protein
MAKAKRDTPREPAPLKPFIVDPSNQGAPRPPGTYGVHIIQGDEKIVLRPAPYLLRLWEAFQAGFKAALAKPRIVRRRSAQDPIKAVIVEKWGPDWPPMTLSTPKADQMLADELDERGIKASPDSRKRAMGRR